MSAAGTFSPASGAPAASGARGHYATLDLMRGIAALGVVLYHFSDRMELPWLVNHGYLAVDFFFALSGFVMAEAYEGRLRDGRLGTARFAVTRAVRLLPLVVLGTLAAYALESHRPDVGDHALHDREALLALALNSVLLPTPFSTTLHGTLFPLNGPVWSLFFEAIANAALPGWARSRHRGAWLVVGIVAGGTGLAWGAWTHGTVQLGFDWDTVAFGFPRVAFSFCVGLALHRAKRFAPRCPAWVPAGMLCIAMAVGPLGAWTWAYDLSCVLVVLPATTFMAVGARGGPGLRRASAVSGDLSYPAYALHFPVVRVVTTLAAHHGLGEATRFGIAVASTAGVAVVAAAAYAAYDVPVRSWLTGKIGSVRSKARAEA